MCPIILSNMLNLQKPKPSIFPSRDLTPEQYERLNLNFHARINGPIIQRLIHDKSVVLKCASEAMGIDEALIRSKTRKREIVIARMLAAVYLLSNYRMSLAAVGEYLGGKDHATILNAHKKYTDWSEINDPVLVTARNEFINLLKKRNSKFSTKLSPYERKIA